VILEELRQVDGVERVEDLAGEAEALEDGSELERVGGGGLKPAGGGEEDLEERGSEIVEAILEVEAERVVVEGVAEAGEEGGGGGEEGVGRGDVLRGEGGAKGGDDGGEERLPLGEEVGCGGGGQGLGELRLDEGRGCEEELEEVGLDDGAVGGGEEV
jgi:hypothetical protein